MKRRRRSGFTLIELLVVIAIIAILAAILFPVFSQAREKAVEAQCLSHGKQIATAVRMYVDDYGGKWPPLTGFNENPPAGHPDHRGPEQTLEPYTKAKQLFRCPADSGGPYTGGVTYYEKYGQSFQLASGCFSKIPGLSYVNDQDVTAGSAWFPAPYFSAKVVSDGEIVSPSSTRIIREVMLPWLGSDPKYAYEAFYRKWHSRGGTVVFADGHAVFMTSQEDFDRTIVTPDGLTTAELLAAGRPDWW